MGKEALEIIKKYPISNQWWSVNVDDNGFITTTTMLCGYFRSNLNIRSWTDPWNRKFPFKFNDLSEVVVTYYPHLLFTPCSWRFKTTVEGIIVYCCVLNTLNLTDGEVKSRSV
jgi:hypothetical protein